MMYQVMPRPPVSPPHYFDSAEALVHMQGEGRSLAEMASLMGLTIPQVTARLQLATMEAGLRTLLRREGAPEPIALTLLQLSDPVSRRRLALRIIRERLCIRDAALLVASARRRFPKGEPLRQQVITVMRDVRPYRNAIRDIAEQMKTAGVRATFTERKSGGMLEMTVSYPARRRRMERYHSM
ncbi:MAG: hypothetical protein IKL25_00740 [Clostridia bacterium]|nr:hypothetical protein [Clostridia bacterium]